MDWFSLAKKITRQTQAEQDAFMSHEDRARIDPPEFPDEDEARKQSDYEAEIAADKFEGRGT
jgi:hypothetical protein